MNSRKCYCKIKTSKIRGDIANFLKRTDLDDKLKNLNKKVTSNKSTHLLIENEFKELHDEIEKLKTYNYLFIGQSYFFFDGAQLYLIL